MAKCCASVSVGYLLAFAVASTIANLVMADQEPQHNIVVIVVDDLGWSDLGCYGSTFYETPFIDQLAASGVRFPNAYASCPVCSPTRASLMTGLWPQRTGITDYIGAAGGKAWQRNTKLLPTEYADRLPIECNTVADVAKAAGYQTFFAGKWHLGPVGYWPEDQGFDHNLGGIDQGGPYGGKKYFSPYDNPRLPDGPLGEHLPDRLANETAKFITDCQATKQPFLAYLSFYSVHTPLMSRKELREKYEAKRKKLPVVDVFGDEPPRKVRIVQEHATYAGMVEAMDAAVGKVLDRINELEIEDNTLIYFTSDNGGLSTSEGSPTSNRPLRAGKGWLYEGGIRVPMIIRAPWLTKAGTIDNRLLCSVDLFPTLTNLMSPTTENDLVDGANVLDIVIADRPLFWHYPHYGNQGGAPGAAVRSGDWKLIHWYEDDNYELFNLVADIGEQHDLAKQFPTQVHDLTNLLREWLMSINASFPSKNPVFNPNEANGRG